MKNLYITWKPEHALGIPILDEQHRAVVATINSLFYFMQQDRGLMDHINQEDREYAAHLSAASKT